jgi:hypothetical protein
MARRCKPNSGLNTLGAERIFYGAIGQQVVGGLPYELAARNWLHGPTDLASRLRLSAKQGRCPQTHALPVESKQKLIAMVPPFFKRNWSKRELGAPSAHQ